MHAHAYIYIYFFQQLCLYPLANNTGYDKQHFLVLIFPDRAGVCNYLVLMQSLLRSFKFIPF